MSRALLNQIKIERAIGKLRAAEDALRDLALEQSLDASPCQCGKASEEQPDDESEVPDEEEEAEDPDETEDEETEEDAEPEDDDEDKPPRKKRVYNVTAKPCCGSRGPNHKRGCVGPATSGQAKADIDEDPDLDAAFRPEPDKSDDEDEKKNGKIIELRCGDCEEHFDGVLKPSTQCPQCSSFEIYKMYP